jgi:hypothetical protein
MTPREGSKLASVPSRFKSVRSVPVSRAGGFWSCAAKSRHDITMQWIRRQIVRFWDWSARWKWYDLFFVGGFALSITLHEYLFAVVCLILCAFSGTSILWHGEQTTLFVKIAGSICICAALAFFIYVTVQEREQRDWSHLSRPVTLIFCNAPDVKHFVPTFEDWTAKQYFDTTVPIPSPFAIPKFRLVPEFQGWTFAKDARENMTLIFVILTIKNAFSPTIAARWELSFKLANDQRLEARRYIFDEEATTVLTQNGNVTFYRDDNLSWKTAEHPIPTGGQVTGWLVFGVQGTDYEQQLAHTNPLATLTFEDVTGKVYSATDRIGLPKKDLPLAFPGMKPPNNQVPSTQRHLTEAQRQALREFGERIPSDVFFYVYAVSNSIEAEAYGKEIWNAIGSGGKQPHGSYITWGANVQPIPTGLIVSSMLTPPQGPMFATAVDLEMTMRRVGMPNVSANNYAPMDGNPSSVTLVVGVRPSFD